MFGSICKLETQILLLSDLILCQSKKLKILKDDTAEVEGCDKS
jgi:hypothetical protein